MPCRCALSPEFRRPRTKGDLHGRRRARGSRAPHPTTHLHVFSTGTSRLSCPPSVFASLSPAVSLFSLVWAVLSFAHHHFFFVGWTFGMQLRISTTTILYDKILRLRLSSLGQVRGGTRQHPAAARAPDANLPVRLASMNLVSLLRALLCLFLPRNE